MNYIPQREWPRVHRTISHFDSLSGSVIGNDAEWDMHYNRPTIVAFSDGDTTICTPWNVALPHFRRLAGRKDITWVLHNGLAADIPIFREHGVNIAPEQVQDTILWWWLTHPNLCKTTKKSRTDESERRGAGYMNLYAMASVFTSLPNWKVHRGDPCSGPCPTCDPFGYCGLDALAPVLALPGLQRMAALRGVDHLYPLHRDLMVAFSEMSARGVRVDASYVEKLHDDLITAKTGIRAKLPFNPESPKQILAEYPELRDTSEQSVRDAVEAGADDTLELLLEYKELGDGPDRWFAPREWNAKNRDWTGYVDKNGYIHPRFSPFTSSGRIAAAGPNPQNIAKRRLNRGTGENIGGSIRRAVIAPEGQMLIEADYKNAENRVMLWLAGYTEIPDIDFHDYMREIIGIKPTDPFALALGGPRSAAKSVIHATNYLEGLKLRDRSELRKADLITEQASGALLVFEDWTFCGKVVTFTGANLARRAFGTASRENRKRALDIQVAYFKAFPKLRELQKRITTEIERERMVKPPSGLFVPSYGFPEDRLKTALAIFGQQPVAHLTKLALIEARKQADLSAIMQVHDALVFYCDRGMNGNRIREIVQALMVRETASMPGLVIPVDIKTGLNWADMEAL